MTNRSNTNARRQFLKANLVLGVIAASAVSSPSYAKDAIYTSFFNDKAVGGYDAVSYFQEGGPKEGSKDFSIKHKGATWLFSNQENLDLFTANPEKYSPQYGGYCAYAVALDQTAKGDPLQWHIENDKLYLNINKSIRSKWLGNIDGYIKDADGHWPTLLN